MFSLGKRLKTVYEPLNIISVIKHNIIHNYQYLNSIDTTMQIAPVLKSNAYGHGLSLIGEIVDTLAPPFLCVDSLYEAYALLKNGVKTHMLVMGYIHTRSLQTKKLPFSFTVFNKETVDTIQLHQPHAPIHVFVDTGMHREGISIEDLPSFIHYIQTNTQLKIEGLMSHFALSDQPDNLLTRQQINAFEEAQTTIKRAGIQPKWLHIANSSALLNSEKYKGKLGNVARVGKAFYGYDPEGKNTNLYPALEFITHIAQIKYLKKGGKLGYDFTFTAPRDMTIAILPAGYNDGIDRRLSNIGVVTINNHECAIIGRVSMNITTIDVSDIKNLRIGDEVTVFTKNLEKRNTIVNTAMIANSITHEILVHLHPSTKRIIVE